MRTTLARSFRFAGPILLYIVVLGTALAIAGTGQKKLVAVDSEHIAIKGYDTVAYFTDGRAVKGSSRFEYLFDGAKWQFSSAAHRGMFVADPDHYMPQYGGFCAGCVGTNACLEPADPEAWAIVNGKLYMVSSKKFLDQWKAKSKENIKQADAHWPVIQQRHSTSATQ